MTNPDLIDLLKQLRQHVSHAYDREYEDILRERIDEAVAYLSTAHEPCALPVSRELLDELAYQHKDSNKFERARESLIAFLKGTAPEPLAGASSIAEDLQRIDRAGGLGYDAHNAIRTAIGYLESLTASPPPVPEQWRPIETAPKDGTTVLLFRRVDSWRVRGYGYWSGGESFVSGWVTNGFSDPPGNLGLADPSHWAPLPEYPTATKEPVLATRSCFLHGDHESEVCPKCKR